MNLSILDIMRATAEVYGLTMADMTSACRDRRVAWPRQQAAVLARLHTGRSLPAIARAFGNRDHTTIIHAMHEAGPESDRWGDDSDARRAILVRAGELRDARVSREQAWVRRLLAGEVIFDTVDIPAKVATARAVKESAQAAYDRAVRRGLLVQAGFRTRGNCRPRTALPSDLPPPSQARLTGARA